MSILKQIRSLLSLYTYMAGTSEVPTHFHYWSCLSLLAAIAEDRVWYEKHKDMRLIPNLYVFLYGPSALGKGLALGMAHKMFLKCRGGGKSWHGSTTREHTIDLMGKKGMDEQGNYHIPSPKLWLVTDELGDDIGRGPIADNFIKFMTKLYTSVDATIDTGTRTHSAVSIENPCINWLAGTTEEWMIESLNKNVVGAGFPSRVAFVEGKYDPTKRYVRPIYPQDYEEVKDHVLTRLWLLYHIKGVFVLSDEARAREAKWYYNRPFPQDADLVPSWKREQDFILKLAMLLVLAEGGVPLVIEERHLVAAMRLSMSVQRNLPVVVEAASATPELTATKKIESVMRGSCDDGGWIGHKYLYDRVKGKGITSKQLRVCLIEMLQNGLAERAQTPTGATLWRLVG